MAWSGGRVEYEGVLPDVHALGLYGIPGGLWLPCKATISFSVGGVAMKC